MQLILLVKRRH